MQTAHVSQTRDGTRTVTAESLPWTKIQRAAQFLATHRIGGSPDATAPDECVRYMLVNGKQYEARSGTLDGPGSPVVLVVLERCERNLPADEEMLRGFQFTPSEVRVALLLAERRSNREIAEELGVTEHTARRHTEKVLQKAGVHRRVHVKRALSRRRKV